MHTTDSPSIGRVVEITGERALVELTADPTRRTAEGCYPGQPGSHVKIPFEEHNIVGIVSGVRMDNGHDGAPTRQLADCLLVGTLYPDGRFGRGVAVYPTVGQRVGVVAPEELRRILAEFVQYGYAFGRHSQAEDQRAFVQADRFFGQHVAVLGNTGCGKSCTVVSVLQHAIRQYPNSHIIVLDLHGEYASAFPDNALLVPADEVELPYWLLNFDEFQALFVDQNEPTAQNQASVLRDAIVRAKMTTDSNEQLGLGKAITADAPIFFELPEVLEQIRSWNIQMVSNSEGRTEPGPLFGAFDKFLIRLDARTSDPRFRFMFAPTSCTNDGHLPGLLRDYLSIDTGKRIAVIDLSAVPSEALGVVVGVVSRLVYEFNLWNPVRQHFPVLMVYEEAHHYLPSRLDPRFATARTAVERIAKEGRKYGIGMIVVSQRPKELSETVLSQCNTYVAMRLSNPEDQAYVRKLVPDSLAGLMNMLPALRTGEALVVGDSVPLPTKVLIDCPDPRPESTNVEFCRWWTEGEPLDVERVLKRWRARRKDL